VHEPLEIERCPTLVVLLQAQDGDLSSSHAAAVWAHVRRCAQCRARLHACVTAERAVRDERESAPGAAAEREIAFLRDLHDQSRKQSRIHVRAARWMRTRAVPIAAVTLIALALSFTWWPSATLQAEALLERAALSEQSRPAGWAQKVLVRVTMPAGPRASTTHAARPLTFEAQAEIGDAVTFDLAATGRTTHDIDPLIALFARHHLDWHQPTSIARLRAWRASLSQKRETVTRVDADTHRLHITTDEGELGEVDVVVHNVSLAVIHQTLVFRDGKKIEIATQGPPEVRIKPVGQTASSGYKAAATPITPPPLAPPTMSELRPIEPPPLFGGAAIPQGALSRWLETTFGSDEQKRSGFVPDLVQRVSAVKRDLYTLEHLAHPSSAAAAPGLSTDRAAAVRAATQRRVARQAKDLTSHLEALATSMAMFGTTSRALPRSQLPANWRDRTTEALAQLDRFEAQLADLLRHDDVPMARDEQGGLLPHPVSESFSALWDAWHAPREP
jgi:hypothetical protein